MGYFERRLVRPTHVHVVETLEQATREANEVIRAVEQDREQWDAFLSDIRSEPEGCHEWDLNRGPGGAGGLGIAWWTDHLGRRHFRIYAGSSVDGSFNSLFPPKPSPRPPLWHIAPEQVFARSSGGAQDWLAVCACGMAGTPQAIGWMGDRCGCCHYKQADAPSEAPVRLSSFADAGATVQQLAFSPDGRWLAAVVATGRAHVWDVEAGRYHGQFRPSVADVLALTFTPDSKHLAIAGDDRMLHFIDVVTKEEMSAYPTPKAVRSIVIAPDNLTLAIVGEGTLEVWGRPDTALPWLPTYVRQMDVHGVAFDARGDRLAVAGKWEFHILHIRERAGCPASWPVFNYKVYGPVAFSPDGRGLVGINESRNGPLMVSSVSFWDLEFKKQTSHHALRTSARAQVLSHNSAWVAGIDDSAVVIENVRNGHWWFRLDCGRWAQLHALAFSPDGYTLATGDSRGTVKLWPWRRLVEA
jgi:hypothetical protein